MLAAIATMAPPRMAFFSRSFILLWQGQLVSQLGNQAFLLATTYLTLEHTQSTTLVAAVMMASTLPIVLLGPLGGAFADRHSRRKVLIGTDFARALAVGGLSLLLFWQPELTAFHVALVIAIAALCGVMSALFAPAIQAIVPDLVSSDRLASANAISQISSQASLLVGQAVGGALYVLWGAAGLLLFDALSFAYAGAATCLLPAELKPAYKRWSIRAAVGRYAVDTREGLAFVKRQAGMASVLVIFAGLNFLFMPVFVLLPLYVRQILGRGPVWYGFLLAGAGAGALVGSAISGLLLARIETRARLIGFLVGGIACAILVLAATHAVWMALIAFVTIGTLSSAINVLVVTAFQVSVPTGLRGRVMALVISFSTAAAPVGMGLGGVLGDLWRDSLLAIFVGCGVVMVLLATIVLRAPGVTELLDRSAGTNRNGRSTSP